MLMSDRDIRASIEAGEIGLEPLDMSLLQPSSFDVRIDRFFRLFDNHKYAFIDPAEQQDDLTRFVEVAADEPFILHPGEFVRRDLQHTGPGLVGQLGLRWRERVQRHMTRARNALQHMAHGGREQRGISQFRQLQEHA